MTEPNRVCKKHNTPLKYSRKLKTWYCPDCLHAAYLTYQAQQEAVKRYRGSEKGKDAQERYEQSEKGQTARNRYLKSAKYKQRRKEYNQRLKESLQIARAARIGGPRIRVPRVVPTDLPPLVSDILEYQEMVGRSPSTADVKEWSNDLYKKSISTTEARKLIEQAENLPTQ